MKASRSPCPIRPHTMMHELHWRHRYLEQAVRGHIGRCQAATAIFRPETTKTRHQQVQEYQPPAKDLCRSRETTSPPCIQHAPQCTFRYAFTPLFLRYGP